MTNKEMVDVIDAMRQWIRKQVTDAGLTDTVVGVSGGADSALVAMICQKEFGIHNLAVFLPCQSSPSSLSRARELCEKFNIDYITMDLEHAFTNIRDQFDHERKFKELGTATDYITLGNLVARGSTEKASKAAFMAQAGLKSCLRAPVLDFIAKQRNALVVGTGNRDEDEVVRYYQKRGDGAVDISPIAKLHKSEVYQLLRYLGCPQSIVEAVPSADLWGPESGQEDEKELGLTYDEIEWGTKFGEKTGLWRNAVYGEQELCLSLSELDKLSLRQITVLQKMAAMEKSSRHKAQLPPVFDARNYINEE